MAEASLAAQRAAVTAMRSRAALTALIPSTNIMDRSGFPERMPCILVGEAQVQGDDIDCADLSDIYLDVHVWAEENVMTKCKDISGEVRRALRNLSVTQNGFALDFNFESANYMRDPNGQHSHGVLTFYVTAEDTVGIT